MGSPSSSGNRGDKDLSFENESDDKQRGDTSGEKFFKSQKQNRVEYVS